MDETGDSSVLLVARCLLAGLFLWSGVGKVGGYGEAVQLVNSQGLMGVLVPVTIVIEVTGALLLVIGFKTRFVALALAGFSVVTALLFHANFADKVQMQHFLTNFAVVGGLLALYVAGPGRLSFDGVNDATD
jgi:putative oxidoreductase